jgi:hypothetical protein
VALVFEGVANRALVEGVASRIMMMDGFAAMKKLNGFFIFALKTMEEVINISKKKTHTHSDLAGAIITLWALNKITLSHKRDYKPFR